MTRGRIRRDIIDNTTGGITMQKVLCSEIPLAKRFDVSTGYFDVAGYGLLRQDLETAVQNDSFSMRLLLGKGALPSTATISFEQRAEQHAGRDAVAMGDELQSVKDALDEAELDKKPQDDTSGLISVLERSNVQVRIGPITNHQ